MNADFKKLMGLFVEKRHWVIIPMLLFTSLAVVYSVFKQEYWESRQALYIRDESGMQSSDQGRFSSVDSMQTVQETILELSHHPVVVRQAMRDVGPYKKPWLKRSLKNWPSDKAVADFMKSVSISAPKGAEFGRTELIYLSVKAETVDRATKLAEAMTHRLVGQMKVLRRQKYESMIDELAKKTSLARVELERAVTQLERLEKQLGSNLVELRVLNNNSMGSSTTRSSHTSITGQLQVAKSEYNRKKLELNRLLELRDDPASIMATPSDSIRNDPALSGLQKAMTEAKALHARLSGEMSADHPRVRAAALAKIKIQDQIAKQVHLTIDSLSADVAMTRKKIDLLTRQVRASDGNITSIANLRAKYQKLTKEVEHRQSYYAQVETELAKARSNRAAATAASTIQVVDDPIRGVQPIGPGGKVICLAGMVGGALTGIGLIWLFAPMEVTGASDFEPSPASATNRGRRASDRFGRRASDWLQNVWPHGAPNGDGATSVPGGQFHESNGTRHAAAGMASPSAANASSSPFASTPGPGPLPSATAHDSKSQEAIAAAKALLKSRRPGD